MMRLIKFGFGIGIWTTPALGGGGPSGSTFLLEDGTSRLLLEDGTYLLME
jgi:hypothetical protein